MARDDPHFRLRFPDELREKVEAAANANHRSMTAEIIARLEGTFGEELELTPAEVVSAIIEYEKRIEALETAIERIHDLTGTQPWNER